PRRGFPACAGDRDLALHAEFAVLADGAVPLVLARLRQIDGERSRLTGIEVRRQLGLAVRALHLQAVHGSSVVLDAERDLAGLGDAWVRRVDLEITQADVDRLG